MTANRHTVTKIAENTWCISEFNLVNAFLIAGKTHAALIDTGCGIGDIMQAVKEITALPIKVLITHAHPDHDGGVYRMDGCPVYIHSIDGITVDSYTWGNEIRSFFVTTRVPVRFPGEGNVEMLKKLIPSPEPSSKYKWQPIMDNEKIDLGGRVLTAVHTPGHTNGSICFIDEQTKILFSGDTVNKSIILMRMPNNDTEKIKIYHDSLNKLWKISDKYEQLAIGHDGITVSKQIVKDYLDLTQALLNGSVVGAYEEKGIRKGDVARLGLAELWYQCDA